MATNTLSQRIRINDKRLDDITLTSTFDASGVDISGSIGVSGEAVFRENVEVYGNTYLRTDVDISGTLGVSGEATFESAVNLVGSFDVSGVTTLDDTLNVNADALFRDNVDITGTLGVSGETTLDGGLVVTSDASFVGHVDISGRLDVSGEIYLNGIRVGTFVDDVEMEQDLGVKGSLDISGTTTLHDTLQVNADALFDENVDISGTLGVSGEATFDASLNVNGRLDVSGEIYLNGVRVGTFVDDVFMHQNLGISGDLDVSGEATFDGGLTVHSDASFTSNVYVENNVDISGDLDVSGETTLDGGLVVTSDASFVGHVDISGRLDVSGEIYLNGVRVGTFVDDVFMHQNLGISGDLDVSGEATFDGGMVVSSDASFTSHVYMENNVDISGDLDVSGVTTLTGHLQVDSDASFTENVYMKKHLNVVGDASFNDSILVEHTMESKIVVATQRLFVGGDVSLNQDLDITGNTKMTGNLTVNSDMFVSGQINATSLNVSDSTFSYTTTHINSEYVDISDNVLMLGTAMDQNVASGICVKDISGTDATSNIFFGWSGRTANQTIKNKFFIGRVQDTFDNSSNKDSDISFNVEGQAKVDTYVTGDVFSNGRNLYDWSHQIYSVIAEVADLSGGAHSPVINYSGSWPLSYGAGTSDVSAQGFGTVAIINSKLIEEYITGAEMSDDFDLSFTFHKIGTVNQTVAQIGVSDICDNNVPIEIGFTKSDGPMKHHVFTDTQLSRGDIFAWKVKNINGGAERLRMTMIFTPTIAPVLSIGNDYGVIGRNAAVEHPDTSDNVIVTTENTIYDTAEGEYYQDTIYSSVIR